MDVIGDLLRAGLLTQIGEGEDRVEMIRVASQSLAARFASELRHVLPHAVVAAVDEAGPVDVEPMLAADEALITQWATYRNVFPEPPAEILRALLMSAVATAADADPKLRAAGWYSLRSTVELLPASRWQTPLSDLARAWDTAVWTSVEQSWSPEAASSTLRMPSVPKFEGDRIEIESAARQQAQEYVDQGNYQNFATAMVSSYVQHVDHLLAASEVLAAHSHRMSVDALRNFSSDLGTKLRDSLAVHERVIESMRLRNDLLWWQQTAFSPSRRVGYSTLRPAEVPLVAALDLHQLMPAVAPLAAEHMLSDLVARASGDAEATIDDLAAVEVDLPAAPVSAPAIVLDSIQGGATTPLLDRDCQVRVGRLAVLVFRELQTRRLTTEPTPGAS